MKDLFDFQDEEPKVQEKSVSMQAPESAPEKAVDNGVKRVFIVDGYGQIYRSYFAFITNPLKDKNGNNVSAVFGFFNIIMMLVRQYKPDYLVVAMDSKGKTFRHELYDQYKANRDKTPDDLHAQIPVIERILDGMHIPHYAQVGMEADDIIATIARNASSNGIQTVMVTGDKDLLQLVRNDVSALRPPRKGEKEYRLCGETEVGELFGVRPNQIVDYLTILGDSSDNVPGIDGIGEKGAVKLLGDYGTLANAYENIASLSKGLQAKLEAARDHIELSRTLVTLKDDLFTDKEMNLSDYTCDKIDWATGVSLFQEIGADKLAVAAKKFVSTDYVAPVESPVKESEQSIEFESCEMDEKALKSILDEKGESYVIAVDAHDDVLSVCFGDSKSYCVSKPSELLLAEIGKHKVVCHDAKNLLSTIDFEPYFDTMLAGWLLASDSSRYELEDLAEKYLNLETIKAGCRAAVVNSLYTMFVPLLEENKLRNVLDELEMPLVKVLHEMESEGITLNPAELGSFEETLSSEAQKVQSEIFTLCEKEFNLNSPKQLQEVLFVDRSLPTGKKTKSGFSTDSDVLENLTYTTDDPVPGLLLRYRLLNKLLSTYVQTLPSLADSNGRIHTSFLQTGTATGRLSSKNPNLQNIPIRTEEGRRIRNAFVPKTGCVLMSADYSQIELVVLSHVSGDVNLRSSFMNGEDVHKATAALIYGVFPEMVTPEMRRTAKTINFGIMYGMSAFRLAGDLKIPRKEAQSFIDTYFEQYKGVSSFIEKTKQQAKVDGYVKTALGHIRYIPEMKSLNKAVLAGAERIAVNTVIQGTAAEIMKRAMISLHDAIRQKGLSSKMILQVHDEVILEVPENEVQVMTDVVRSCMENAFTLSVPLRVEIETGRSWGEMH